MWNRLLRRIHQFHLTALLYWIVLALLIGVISGSVGVLFRLLINAAQQLRADAEWLIWLLPLGGLAIAALYKYLGKGKDPGADIVLVAVRDGKRVPTVTAPLIFLSSCLTHLFGGSAGAEGASLQIGGSLASWVSRFLKLDDADYHVFIMCGVTACFSAIIGTPVAAAVFVLEVISVGEMCYAAMVPCVISSLTAHLLARSMGLRQMMLALPMMQITLLSIAQALVLGLLCSGLSVVFCLAMQKTRKFFHAALPNSYILAAAGGALVLALTLLLDNAQYCGLSLGLFYDAIGGHARWYDFMLKLAFTAITLGAGFKGGELIPSFVVGACFGCWIGPWLGLDAGFAACLGMVAVFCGITNCPLAAIILGVEYFGSEGLVYFALVCSISYMTSGYYSLYGEQHFLFDKTKAVHLFHNSNRI